VVDIRRPGEPDADHLSWFEIADAMYLAEFIGQSPPVPEPNTAAEPAVRSTTPIPERTPDPVSTGDSLVTARRAERRPTERVIVAPHVAESRTESGEQISVEPLRPVLDVPGIVRGLRPLRRKIQSWRANDIVLDEDATAKRAVQNELWLPLTKRATERWLDLTLIVDSGPSMALWRAKINAFEALMRRMGTFRTVQRRSLDTGRTDTAEPVLRGGTPTASERSLGELLDPSGRRVVLVVTDGVSRIWQSPNIAAMLARLGCAMPTALVHLLPQRVWRQTGLNLHRVLLKPRGRLVPNNRWSIDLLDNLLDDPEPTPAVPIPVLEMEGRWLGRLAHVLIGRDEPVSAAVLMARAHSEFPYGASWLSPSDQVSEFLTTASPAAFRLATLLAAVPVNLRTVCRIQAEVVPEARVEHIAEVLCSPLFQPHPHAHADSPWEKIAFTVDPEVRKELLSSARRSETARVVRMTSSYGRIWKALDAPDSTDLLPSAMDENEVAIERIVMEALSGPYLAHAERLGTTTVPLVDNISSGVEPVRVGPTPLVDRPTGGSPQVWGDVPQRNPAFIGRADLLNALDAQLTADVPVVLHGWGGAGKTQIAVECVYRHVGDYDLVWWIDATSATRIRAALVELAQQLGLPGAQEANAGVPVVLDMLRRGWPYRRWLLVFDGTDEPDIVRPFLVHGGAGRVLMTSRNSDWTGVAQPVEVRAFRRSDSVALVKHRKPDMADTDADRLAEALGDYPLALEQAAVTLTETGMSVDEYLWLFDDKQRETPKFGERSVEPPPMEQVVAAVWNVSLDMLKQRNPEAYQLLEICAFFSAHPIPRYFFAAARGVRVEPELSRALRDPTRLARAIRDINRYGLAGINHRNETIQLQRMVRLILRERVEPERHDMMAHCAHVLIVNLDPNDPLSQRQWSRYQDLMPHVYASGIVRCDESWGRGVAVNLMRFLYRWGDHEEALSLAELTLGCWREKLGDEDRQTLMAATELAYYYWIAGRFDDAAAINREVLAIRRRVDGENDEETFAARAAVAADLRTRGDFVASAVENKDIHRGTLELFGPNDPVTLRFARHYGISLRLVGDYRRAAELDNDTYERATDVLGSNHPETLSVLAGLVLDRREAGEYLWARDQWKLLADRARQIHGDGTADTLRRQGYLAVAMRMAGEYTAALELSTDILARFRTRYGPHSFSFNALACELGRSVDLRRTGDLEHAKEVGQSALQQYRTFFDDRHPFVRAAEVDLAVTLRLLGDPLAARVVDEHALELLQARLGRDHGYAIVCAINLASDLAALGETDAAYALSTEVVARAERMLGANHPTTLAASLNLVFDTRPLDWTPGLESRYADIVRRHRDVLGAEHPATINAEKGVRADCDIDPLPL
jgi:tetratricopeptide (TPR) repeat protein